MSADISKRCDRDMRTREAVAWKHIRCTLNPRISFAFLPVEAAAEGIGVRKMFILVVFIDIVGWRGLALG